MSAGPRPAIRVTTYLREDQISKIHGLMYRDHMDFKEVLEEALDVYLGRKDIPPAPYTFVAKLKKKGRRKA